jgi:aspartyl-tRNA(Asn)/glutamyl-tRNA(Gln) amidotransferase subunit B
MRLINDTGADPEDLSVDADKLAVLIGLVLDKKINRGAYKEAVEAVFSRNADPEAYVKEKGLEMVSDTAAIEALAESVIAANPGAAADYKAGKQKAFGFLVGQVLKQLGGTGNPNLVKEEMLKKLNR